MIHPNLRDVGVQMYTDEERKCFRGAIEIMIMFDIKLRDISDADKF
jgi:hypothetical protein